MCVFDVNVLCVRLILVLMCVMSLGKELNCNLGWMNSYTSTRMVSS